MSGDIYDEHLDVVQDSEIGPSGPLLHAPDALRLAGPVHHQGADYGPPDTTVTVTAGVQVVHVGVAHHGGETARVPHAIAAYWVRSGWATTESEDTPVEPEPVGETERPAAPPRRSAPAKAATARATAAGSGRRKR